jgi:FkbM family methyltransferase
VGFADGLTDLPTEVYQILNAVYRLMGSQLVEGNVRREKTLNPDNALWSLISRCSTIIPSFFVRPEYLYNPRRIGRRIWRQLDKGGSLEEVMLPWGAPLLIEPDDTIGRTIWTTGVYDLIVLEALLRLADTGELALDVGANIGLMTSALARAVGPSGKVISFEPHPILIPKLCRNIDLWHSRLGWTQTEVDPVALSGEEGKATLTMPSDFAMNRGIATLEPSQQGESVEVVTTTLDAILCAGQAVGVMKLDVEGHEHGVLAGSVDLLSSGRIRDIIFEEHNKYPTVVTRLLELHGYEVFGLRKGMFGPQLTSAADAKVSLSAGEAPNYLATRDGFRATVRLRSVGWQALAR